MSHSQRTRGFLSTDRTGFGVILLIFFKTTAETAGVTPIEGSKTRETETVPPDTVQATTERTQRNTRVGRATTKDNTSVGKLKLTYYKVISSLHKK